MEYKIALMPGDGIGPEIIKEARKVIRRHSKGLRTYVFL